MAGGRGFAGALGLIACLGVARADPPRVVRARAIEAAGPVFDAAVQPRLLLDFAPTSARWIGAGEPRPFTLETERAAVGHRVQLRLDPPPEGPGKIEVRGADRVERVSARWLPRGLRDAVKARGRVWRGSQAARERAWAEGKAILARLPDDPWVIAERGLLDVARHGAGAVAIEPIAARLEARSPAAAGWFLRVITQQLGRAGHFRQAAAWAGRARRLAQPHDPISAHLQAALDAQISLWGGRYDKALVDIDRALDGAITLGDADRRFHYEQLKTDVLAGLGRHFEAVALAEALHARRPSPATAVGRDWQLLDAMRRCAIPPRYDLLVAPLAAAARDPAHSRWVRQAAAINGLLAATMAGEGRIADALATEATTLNDRGPWVALAQLLAADRAAQRRDWPAAQAGYARVLADAARRFGGVATDETWQALAGLGRIARAQAATGIAALFFDEALAALDEASRAATARRHRADWFADRRQLVLDAVRNRLDLGLDTAAVALLDRYRAPATRTLLEDSRIASLAPTLQVEWAARIDAYEDARAQHAAQVADCEGAAIDDRGCRRSLRQTAARLARRFDAAHRWLDQVAPPLAAAGLPTLPDGRAALLVADFTDPAACGRRIRFGAVLTADRVAVAPAGADPLAWWLPQLRGFEHLYLVGDAPDLVALPQRPVAEAHGPVWGESQSMSYVPSLAWLAQAPRPTPGRPVAIIDPDGTLQRPLTGIDDPQVLILRGSAATHARTLAALDGAPWLLFDGHGVVDGDAWTAHLALADGPLTVADLLARRPAIGTAILSGCESGRGARWSRAERLGLADAFVLAGARAVLATDIEVPVEPAARFVEGFVAAGGMTRPGPAWRQVVGEMRRQGDGAWRHWRLFGQPGQF